MPMYDYRCEDCRDKFTVLIRWDQKHQVRCPKCDSDQVRELISTFATKSAGGSSSSSWSSGGSCGSGSFG